jgi:hypothetical protein
MLDKVGFMTKCNCNYLDIKNQTTLLSQILRVIQFTDSELKKQIVAYISFSLYRLKAFMIVPLLFTLSSGRILADHEKGSATGSYLLAAV